MTTRRTVRTFALLCGTAALVASSLTTPSNAAITADPVQQLSTTGNAENIPPPLVRAAADGYAVAVWADTDPGDGKRYLYVSLRSPEGTWAGPTRLSWTIGGQGIHPDRTYYSVDMNRSGDVAVAWQQEGAILVAQLPRGESDWAGRQVSGDVHEVDDFSGPATTVLPDGTATLAWRADSNPDPADTFSRLLVASGTPGAWSAEEIITGKQYVPVVGDPGEPDVERGFSLTSDGAGTTWLRWIERTDVPVTSGMPTMRKRMSGASRAPGSAWSDPTPLTDVLDPYAEPQSITIAGDRLLDGFAEMRQFAPTSAEVAAGTTEPRIQLRHAGAVRTFRGTAFKYSFAGVSAAGGQAVARLYWNDGSTSTGFTTSRDGAWSDLESPLGVDDTLYSGSQAPFALHDDGGLSMVYLSGSTRRVRAVHRAPGATTWDASRAVSSTSAVSSADAPVVTAAQGRQALVTWLISGDVWAGGFTSDTPPVVTPPPSPTPTPTTFTRLSAPTVTGKLRVGRTLRARPGSWSPTPTSVRFRWLANGKVIRKAVKARLRLTRQLRGKRISLRVTLLRSGVTTKVVTVKTKGRVRSSP
ncbi:MAG: hypothetical protein LT071_11055 [Nocardioides sp.]|nr:hypothetical protein [Nocardioides sp.]